MNIQALGAALFALDCLPSRLQCVCGRVFIPIPDQHRTCSALCAYREAETLLTGRDPCTRCICGRWFRSDAVHAHCSPECATGQLERSAFSDDSDADEVESDDGGTVMSCQGRQHPTPLASQNTASTETIKNSVGVPPPVPPKDHPACSSHRSRLPPLRSNSEPAEIHQTEDKEQPPAVPPRPPGGHHSSRNVVGSAPVPDKPSNIQTTAFALRRARSQKERDNPNIPRVYIPPQARIPLPLSAQSTPEVEHPQNEAEWTVPRSSPSSLARCDRVRRVTFKQDLFEQESERVYIPGVSRSNTVPLRSALRKIANATEAKARPTSDPTVSPVREPQRSPSNSHAGPQLRKVLPSSEALSQVEFSTVQPTSISNSGDRVDRGRRSSSDRNSIVDYGHLICRDLVPLRWKLGIVGIPDVPESAATSPVSSPAPSPPPSPPPKACRELSTFDKPLPEIELNPRDSRNVPMFLERVPNQSETGAACWSIVSLPGNNLQPGLIYDSGRPDWYRESRNEDAVISLEWVTAEKFSQSSSAQPRSSAISSASMCASSRVSHNPLYEDNDIWKSVRSLRQTGDDSIDYRGRFSCASSVCDTD